MVRLTGFVNFRRLAIGAPLVAALIGVLYLLTPSGSNHAIEPPLLLATRGVAGQVFRVGLEPGNLAPNFEISTPNGERVKLEDFRGRPVLINFWARWCTSCLSEMPVIKAAQADRGVESFVVLAINAGETRPRAQEFIDFLEAPFVYGLDPDLTVADAYGVYGLPLSVFIDSTGVIQAVYRGHANRELFETLLNAAISAEPPGPIPLIFRIVSTIPRQRTLLIIEARSGRLQVSSRMFRCDAAFCGQTALAEIASLAGVRSVTPVSDPVSPGAIINYDEGATSRDQLVAHISTIVGSLEDPLYDGQIVVRYASK